MAISVLGSTAAASSNDNDVTTSALDCTGASTIVAVGADASGTLSTLSDSQGNTWTQVTFYIGTSSTRCTMWWVDSPSTNASQTFQLSRTGSFPALAIIALAGTLTSGSLDASNGSGNVMPTSSFQPGSVTPTQDNCIIIAGMAYSSATTATIDGGFTQPVSSIPGGAHNYGVGIAYLIQTTATAADPTWTFGVNTGVAAMNASFLPAGGGGGNPWYAYAQQRQSVVKRRWQRSGLIYTPSYAFGESRPLRQRKVA